MIEVLRCRSHGTLLHRRQPAKAAPIVDLTGPGALAQVHVWPAGTGFVPTADLPLTDEEDEEEEKAFHQCILGTVNDSETTWLCPQRTGLQCSSGPSRIRQIGIPKWLHATPASCKFELLITVASCISQQRDATERPANGSFRKLGLPYFGVLIIRIPQGTLLGPPLFGNSQIENLQNGFHQQLDAKHDQIKIPQILGKHDFCCQRFAARTANGTKANNTHYPPFLRLAPRKRVEGQMSSEVWAGLWGIGRQNIKRRIPCRR